MNDEQKHAQQFMSLLGVDKYEASPTTIDELTSRLAQQGHSVVLVDDGKGGFNAVDTDTNKVLFNATTRYAALSGASMFIDVMSYV